MFCNLFRFCLCKPWKHESIWKLGILLAPLWTYKCSLWHISKNVKKSRLLSIRANADAKDKVANELLLILLLIYCQQCFQKPHFHFFRDTKQTRYVQCNIVERELYSEVSSGMGWYFIRSTYGATSRRKRVPEYVKIRRSK